MPKLAEETNAILYSFEKSELGITFLSFLLLEYHTSTEDYEKYSTSIMDFYGFTVTQLSSSYSELQFKGYVENHKSHVTITDKSKKVFKVKRKVATKEEIQRLKEGFDAYWSLVPKKINKMKAKRVWERLKPNKELVDNITKSLEKQVKYKAKMDSLGKFHPILQQPDRWLTNQRWEDVVPETKSVVKKVKPTRDER